MFSKFDRLSSSSELPKVEFDELLDLEEDLDEPEEESCDLSRLAFDFLEDRPLLLFLPDLVGK